MPIYHQRDHRALESIRWQPEASAERANDHILFSRGTSNSNLVVTPDGDVVINTGVSFEGPRHRERYEQLLDRPLDVRKIILTQFHSDHVGGWGSFTGPGVATIAQREQPRLRAEWMVLTPFYQPRGARFLSLMMPKPGQQAQFFLKGREPEDVIYYDRDHIFEVGDVRFELLSVSSGETLDSTAVWLPGEATLFTGNFLGALYGALPHFYTIRGDRQRSVAGFLRDIQRLIDLEPALLITGHDAPIAGSARIRTDLSRVRDAVRFLHDATIAGMNAGKTLFELMDEVRLPAELSPEPGRGPVHWYVRAVWEEYSGWFRHESTTELYPVPQRAVWPDLVRMAGGADAVVEQARRYLAERRPLEALHMTDIATAVEPAHRGAREAEIAALETLIDASGGSAFDEMGWLESAIAQARAAIA